MTHLILGGNGFIGRHVALRLMRAGHKVIVAGRKVAQPPAAGGLGMIESRHFDLNAADWDNLAACCDVVHHYAWTTIPKAAEDDPAADLNINVGGTIALLEALARAGGKRLIFASSGGTVYGQPRTTPVGEEHPLEPISAYGTSKTAAENYIGLFRTRGVDARIARLANIYGAGQDPDTGFGAVTIFLKKALEDKTISIWGDGSVVRDYLHIADASQALVRLATVTIESPETPVFNIGSGEGHSLHQIVVAIQTLLGRPVRVTYHEGRPFDVPVNVLDIARADAVLGWKPHLSLEAGLARMRDDLAAGQMRYSSLD